MRSATGALKSPWRRAWPRDARLPTLPSEPLVALQLFRAVMPGVSGVVLASEEGHPLAHDVGVDAQGLAAQGLAQHKVHNFHGAVPGASTFVSSGRSIYLVVFLPPDLAQTWAPHLLAA